MLPAGVFSSLTNCLGVGLAAAGIWRGKGEYCSSSTVTEGTYSFRWSTYILQLWMNAVEFLSEIFFVPPASAVIHNFPLTSVAITTTTTTTTIIKTTTTTVPYAVTNNTNNCITNDISDCTTSTQ